LRSLRRAGTIRLVIARRGPGLAKTTRPNLVAVRPAVLVRASDARWRDLFTTADTVSEGGARAEGVENVWYGTTSLVVAFPQASEEERHFYAELALRDPHARLRAVRIAKREAQSRAPAPLGRATCEIKTSVDPRGVRIDVDLQAPLIVERRTGSREGPG
jgi:hypothetical protein